MPFFLTNFISALFFAQTTLFFAQIFLQFGVIQYNFAAIKNTIYEKSTNTISNHVLMFYGICHE